MTNLYESGYYKAIEIIEKMLDEELGASDCDIYTRCLMEDILARASDFDKVVTL